MELCSRRPFKLGEDLRLRVAGKRGPDKKPMKLSERVGRKFRQLRNVCIVEGENLVSEHVLNDQFMLSTREVASLACALPRSPLPSLAPPRGYQPAEVEGGLPGDGAAWSLSSAMVAEGGPRPALLPSATSR